MAPLERHRVSKLVAWMALGALHAMGCGGQSRRSHGDGTGEGGTAGSEAGRGAGLSRGGDGGGGASGARSGAGTIEAGEGGGGAAPPNGGAGGDAGGSGAGGASGAPDGGGAAGEGTWPICGGFADPAMSRYCGDIHLLTVSDPIVERQGAASDLLPGERFEVSVLLASETGHEYPCVGLISDDARVSIQGENPYWAAFAAGSAMRVVAGSGIVDPSMPPGSTVHFTARASIKNADCAGPSLEFNAAVGSP